MKIKLSIIAAALVCAVSLPSCARDDPPPLSTDTSAEISPLLTETEDMGSDYIDSFLFFGESTTYHLKSRGVLSGGTDTKQVLGNKSGTAMLDSTTSTMAVICPQTGELVTFREAVRRSSPKYMLLTFGLNGAVRNVKSGKDNFKANYKKLTDTILAVSPNTKIIIGSCFPVAKNMDMTNFSVTANGLNQHISTLNEWAFELACEEGFRYLNTREVLTDSEGYLKEEYQAGDGHHLTRKAYTVMLDYIRTHGYR